MKNHDAKMLIDFYRTHFANIISLSERFNFSQNFIYKKVFADLFSGLLRACTNQQIMNESKTVKKQNIIEIKNIIKSIPNKIIYSNLRSFICCFLFKYFSTGLINKITFGLSLAKNMKKNMKKI